MACLCPPESMYARILSCESHAVIVQKAQPPVREQRAMLKTRRSLHLLICTHHVYGEEGKKGVWIGFLSGLGSQTP